MIEAAQPDVLLVAYGHPSQELWIARNQPDLRVPLAIGVGGVLDYLAGDGAARPALDAPAGAGVALPACAPALALAAHPDGGAAVPVGGAARGPDT